MKDYIKAIAKWMAEKGRKAVFFDKNTYEDWKRDMPHFLDADTGNVSTLPNCGLMGRC